MDSTSQIDCPKLNRLWERGQQLLGTQYPIMCGAMTWVSDPALVSAVSGAGAFASLACGNMPPEILRQQIHETRERTRNPFAVNLITVAPNYLEHLEIAVDEELPTIIFAGSFPRQGEVEKAKSRGAKVLAFASTQSLAQRMISYGVDGLILEGMEAGGHIGPVAGIVLWQQILFRHAEEIPIFIAGGVSTGKMMAHLLLMGASGVQLGTRFVMTHECTAHSRFKEIFRRARARDAVASPQFDSRLPVIPVRALKNRGNDDFGRLQIELIAQLDRGEITREKAQIQVEHFWMGALKKAAIDGNVEEGSLMAGQVVGLANEIKSVAEVVDELVLDGESTLENLGRNL